MIITSHDTKDRHHPHGRARPIDSTAWQRRSKRVRRSGHANRMRIRGFGSARVRH